MKKPGRYKCPSPPRIGFRTPLVVVAWITGSLAASAQTLEQSAQTPAAKPHLATSQTAGQPSPSAPLQTQNPSTATPSAPQGATQAPTAASAQPPSAASATPPVAPPKREHPGITFEQGNMTADGEITATGVVVTYLNVTITAKYASGNINREILLTGDAHIRSDGIEAVADVIHAYPMTRAFRLDNARAVIDPKLMQGQIIDPVFLTSVNLVGSRTGEAQLDHSTATTCIEPHHHYEIRVSNAILIPHDRLILHQVSFVLFDVKVVTIPYLVIPLDRSLRRFHTDYLPEFGYDAIEGYYARFPYEFTEKNFAATFLRLDFTQRLGEGYRVEQEYLAGKQQSAFNTANTVANGGFTGNLNGAITQAYGYGNVGPGLVRLGTGIGPQSGGLLTAQGYFDSGFNNNFDASWRHQQGIGSNNRFSFTTEIQRNSSFSADTATTENTQFTFDHTDPSHGAMANLTAGLTSNSSPGFSNSQLNLNYRQSNDFGVKGANRNNFSYTITATDSTNSGSGNDGDVADVDAQFQMQHFSKEYMIGLQANKSFDLTPNANGGNAGSLERLPELQFSSQTYNFKGGYLSQLPLQFDLSVGRYSEPGHVDQTRLVDDRIDLGLTLQDFSIMKGRTEMTTGASFEQRFYSDTAAQYLLSDTTRLRQHLSGRSGIDLVYTYQQPEGGTPFFFDLFNRVHNITMEGGYLDDYHFQFTLQTGYNFLKDDAAAPWQSVATRMLIRPNPHVRFDFQATYDINTGQWFDITNSVRLRGRRNFGLDLVSEYDPQTAQWSQINSQYDIPIGRNWRFSGLFRYNGILKQFESRNFQLTYEWDCMEASLTYSENPLGFTQDREIYFTLRIKAIPFFRSFARGPAGEALNAGTGNF